MPARRRARRRARCSRPTAGISGTTDDALYQDERWTPGGSYTYEVAVANGTYQVDLLLAEIYSGIYGPGQRVFDMSLEGQALAALQNIDIYAQVGANAAYTISQQVTVNDGSLSIQVGPGSSSPGNVENAKLNAFAVYSAGAPAVTDAVDRGSQRQPERGQQRQHSLHVHGHAHRQHDGRLDREPIAVTGSGANPADGGRLHRRHAPHRHGELRGRRDRQDHHGECGGRQPRSSPTKSFTVTLSNPSAGTVIGTAAATGTILNDDSTTTPILVKAVNVGGGQVTASNGIVFQADAGPTTGGAASQVFSTTAGISGTTDDALFQDERWTPGGSYTYEVAVANGTYQVDLLLAEIYSGIFGPGQRVFDMSLEGQALAALQNIDVYAQVGANAAYTISQQVTVNDGSLSIEVGPGSSSPGNVQNAKLNAFAVYSAGARRRRRRRCRSRRPTPARTRATAAARPSPSR